MSQARKFAKQFFEDLDGQCWSVGDRDWCEALAIVAEEIRSGDHTDDPVKFRFDDGSSVVCALEAWDFGLSDQCFCWEGAGHRDDCSLHPAT